MGLLKGDARILHCSSNRVAFWGPFCDRDFSSSASILACTFHGNCPTVSSFNVGA